VEWAFNNGEAAINQKMKAKYSEDLSTVTVASYVALPLEAQLRLFYHEFDPKKPESDFKEIMDWVNARPGTGVADINVRMEKKYGENLNTHAYAGRNHMRDLLSVYFRLLDPPRNNPDAIRLLIDEVIVKGALHLHNELVAKYKVGLPISASDIVPPPPPPAAQAAAQPAAPPQNIPVAVAVVEQPRVVMAEVAQQLPPPRQKVMSLAKNERARPLSMALSVASNTPGKLTVSEDMEIRGLVEIFYAKHNPEKLTGEGVDPIMKFVRANGLEALNAKMRDKYGEDLEQLKVQYTSALDQLTKYYKEVDPSKANVDDIAAWAIVHGLQPLSERLEKRYGKPLIPKDDDDEMDPITLRVRIRQFYQVYDEKPKSEEDISTILAWVLAGSVAQLNVKLSQKYGATLNDLPPLEVGEKVFVQKKPAPGLPQAPPPSASTPKEPQPLGVKPTPAKAATPQQQAAKAAPPAGTKTPQAAKAPSPPVSAASTPKGRSHKHEDPDRGEETDSFSFRSIGDMGSGDNYFDEQMSQMRRITSGQYEGLAVNIRAFYRVHDPAKLENKEAFDLILKWTFKHGVGALDKKFQEHYGATLASVKVTDADREALKKLEEDDDAVIDW